MSESSPFIQHATVSAEFSRRGFLATGAGSVLSIIENWCTPAVAAVKLGTHHIPADKNLDPAWSQSCSRGGREKSIRVTN